VAIEETITVDVAGLGAVDDLAGAFDKASESVGKLKDELASLGGGAADGAGAGDIAAAWNDAAAKVSGSIGKIRDEIASLGDAGALAGGAGLDDLVAKYDTAAADISASMDKIAESGGKLDDLGEGAAGAAGEVGKLGDALGGVAEEGAGLGAVGDGIKGIGTSSDEAAAQVAALRAEISATIAETSAMQDKIAAGSADSSLSLAKGDAAMAVAAPSLATSSVEQDAAVAQQQAARKVAAQQAADDASAAEASATKYHLLALGGAAALAYGVDKAAQLQTQVTRLYTSAGESQASLPMDSAGILKLSGETNTSQSQLAQGAYMINSAGFHGQAGLGVLKAAAQGAQAEGAPLSEVGNALTSLMNAYGPQKGKTTSQTAMSDMNEIITMVGQGKMTMAGAVGALPAVLPVASAAHVSFPQVAGALATMTSMGMSPDWAAQNLRHTIGSLQNPNTVQTGEMQQLGLNPVGIAKNLGKTGITGTLDEIQTAVMKSMGPSGLVMLKTFNQSASAAQDATTMMKAMPPAISKVAQSYLDGTISAKQYNAEVFSGSESAGQKNLLSQFATTANAAHGFNAALKSGQPDAQVYSAAMSKILGGTVGLQTALMLTGQHAGTAKANVDAVAASAQHAGDNVKGWSAVQSTLNFQLGSFTKSTEAVATEAGQVALPALTGLMHGLSDVGGFLASNPGLTKPLVEAGGVLAGVAVAGKVASAGATALASVGKVAETLNIPGLSKLSGLGQGSGLDGAAAGLKGSAGDLSGSAADLSEAAATLKEGSAGGAAGAEAGAARTAEGDAAGTAEGAGAGGLFAKVASKGGLDGAGLAAAVTPIAAGVTAGLMLRGYSDSLAPKGTPAGQISQDVQKSNPMSPDWAVGGIIGKLGLSNIGLDIGKDISRAQSAGSQIAGGIPRSLFDDARHSIASLFGGGGPPQMERVGGGGGGDSVKFAQVKPPDTGAFTSAGHAIESAFDSAKSGAGAALSGIAAEVSGAGSKAAASASSGFHAVESAVSSAMSGAASAAESGAGRVVSEVGSIGGKAAAALARMPGELESIGSSAVAGLAHGIEAGIGAVVGAAEHVAGAVEGAMKGVLKSFSPSKVTEAVGVDTSAGLAKGITGGTTAVKTSALTLSAATITSLTQGLQGGTSAIDAAMQAVTGKGSRPQDITTIISTISTLKGDVAHALAAGQVSQPQDSALTRMLTADNAKLQSLSARRTVLETEITDAQQIAQQVLSSTGVMSAGTYTPSLAASDGPLAASATITGMQEQAADQAQFAQQAGQLKKMGLNSASLNQIVQSGASSGLPVAEGLTSGGKGAIGQVNKLQSQIQASAAQLGGVGGPAMYQAGVQAGAGLAQGLESQLGTVDAAISAMARSMVATIEHDLKIKSPSLVFAERGAMVPAGVAMGVDAGAGQAVAAVGRMGSRMTGAYHPGMAYAGYGGGHGGGSGSGGGGGGGDTHITINMTVNGSVSTQQDLVNAVTKGLRAKGAANWQTGIIRPGRAG
jgi:hypothetical protein